MEIKLNLSVPNANLLQQVYAAIATVSGVTVKQRGKIALKSSVETTDDTMSENEQFLIDTIKERFRNNQLGERMTMDELSVYMLAND
ncbi:MAG: hypothetical protein RI894_963 [Bacteroidota bacterium]|jgi:hypothetical protein